MMYKVTFTTSEFDMSILSDEDDIRKNYSFRQVHVQTNVMLQRCQIKSVIFIRSLKLNVSWTGAEKWNSLAYNLPSSPT